MARPHFTVKDAQRHKVLFELHWSGTAIDSIHLTGALPTAGKSNHLLRKEAQDGM